MNRGHKLNIKNENAYFLTLTVVDWIDVFTRKNHADAIIESLKYCQKEKGLIIFAYCIMSNHIHMVVNADSPFLLKDTIRDFKKFTSKKILQQIIAEPESRREWMLERFEKHAEQSAKHKNFMFWQTGNYAKELFSSKFIWRKISYIHNNPVKAGYVNEAHHWKYSSASNYQDMDSIIEVEKIGHRLIYL